MADLPHRVAVATLLTGDRADPVSEIPVLAGMPAAPLRIMRKPWRLSKAYTDPASPGRETGAVSRTSIG